MILYFCGENLYFGIRNLHSLLILCNTLEYRSNRDSSFNAYLNCDTNEGFLKKVRNVSSISRFPLIASNKKGSSKKCFGIC